MVTAFGVLLCLAATANLMWLREPEDPVAFPTAVFCGGAILALVGVV